MDTTLFQDKYTAYQQLIARVQASYPAYHEATEYEKGQLVWCNDCKQEISLWSYWQGSLDAKIVLVGQDWGCPYDKTSLPTMLQIQKANNGDVYDYLSENPSRTDHNLISLFYTALNKKIAPPAMTYFSPTLSLATEPTEPAAIIKRNGQNMTALFSKSL